MHNKLVNASCAKIPEAHRVITLAFNQAFRQTGRHTCRQTSRQADRCAMQYLSIIRKIWLSAAWLYILMITPVSAAAAAESIIKQATLLEYLEAQEINELQPLHSLSVFGSLAWATSTRPSFLALCAGINICQRQQHTGRPML